MDVFDGVLREHHGFLRDAAVHAATDLGVFDGLAAGPLAADGLATRLGVASGRLVRLLDVMALEGLLARRPGASSFALSDPPPRPPAPPPAGFGLLAEVIRRDRPLPPPPPGSEPWRRYHEHLLEAGAPAAEELAGGLLAGRRRLLDAGGGLGAYTRAFLAAEPEASALLLDDEAAAAAAREELAAFGPRATCRAGDLLEVPLPTDRDAVLLANVLHLHPPDVCARLVRRAAAALAPGGLLVVKDVLVEGDRTGPPLGVWFALNLALYADGGDVHAPDAIAAWLDAAGLEDVCTGHLESSPDAIVALGATGR